MVPEVGSGPGLVRRNDFPDFMVETQEVRVSFLPAHLVEPGEAEVELCLDQVGAVANQLGGIPVRRQQLRQMVASAAQQALPRIPGPPHAAGREVRALGDGGEAARVEVAQADTLPGKGFQVRSAHGSTAEGIDVVVAESVGDDDDDVHGRAPGGWLARQGNGTPDGVPQFFELGAELHARRAFGLARVSRSGADRGFAIPPICGGRVGGQGGQARMGFVPQAIPLGRIP